MFDKLNTRLEQDAHKRADTLENFTDKSYHDPDYKYSKMEIMTLLLESFKAVFMLPLYASSYVLMTIERKFQKK